MFCVLFVDIKSLVTSSTTLNNACLYSPITSNVSSLCYDAYNSSKEHLKSMPSTSTHNLSIKNSHLKTENINELTCLINNPSFIKINNNTINALNGPFHAQIFDGTGSGFNNNKLSIQQRNNNICEWLQTLNLNSENDNQIKNGNNFETDPSRSINQSNLSMEVEMSP